MPWTAITDHDAVDAGTTIRIDSGYSDTPPQNGEVIDVAHRDTGRTTSLTVVSAAADRLELTDGRAQPHAEAPCDPEGEHPRRRRPLSRRLDRGMTGEVVRALLPHGFGKRDRRVDSRVTLLMVRCSATAVRRRMIAAFSSPP